MRISRLVLALLLFAGALPGCITSTTRTLAKPTQSYGVLGRMIAVSGQREPLIAILVKGTVRMPGNRSYVIARDLKDANAIWITEVWDSREAHLASLNLPQVQQAIKAARPLIAGFDSRAETQPVRAD